MAVDVIAFVAAEGSTAAVVAIAITAVVIAVADAAHPIVAVVVAISVAFVRNEEGKGQKVLVHLAAVVNVDACCRDYFEIAAHHLC